MPNPTNPLKEKQPGFAKALRPFGAATRAIKGGAVEAIQDVTGAAKGAVKKGKKLVGFQDGGVVMPHTRSSGANIESGLAKMYGQDR